MSRMTEALSNSVPELVAQLRSGELPLLDYLDRLEIVHSGREPELRALVPEQGRFERLRREARVLLERYPDPPSRPPLFGLPVGVKDIFHVAGFPTGGGSRLPPAELQGEEAVLVTSLERSGVLILGKTVSTEFAYFAPGPTRNPHDPERTPGGSSSGSAAAVAAGLCPLALGTQTIGSISRPASFCGVVGYKPTYERMSRDGVIPLAPSLDHVGLFAEEVAGIALTVAILCDDWREVGSLERPVLGIPAGPYLELAAEDGWRHFDRVCARLEEGGYRLAAVEVMANIAEIRARHDSILAAEAARVHGDWYRRYGHLYHPKTVELIERGKAVGETELAEALQGRERLREELMEAMGGEGIDLWISPAARGQAPRGLDSTGDPAMNLPWTHAGLPTLALPAGRGGEGMPLGLQVAAGWKEDEALIAWGGALAATLRNRDARARG
jgi:Asp-tRNA(Asn)/Glu-tRNA(Gln) amidotransferase A subunit family amidase